MQTTDRFPVRFWSNIGCKIRIDSKYYVFITPSQSKFANYSGFLIEIILESQIVEKYEVC